MQANRKSGSGGRAVEPPDGGAASQGTIVQTTTAAGEGMPPEPGGVGGGLRRWALSMNSSDTEAAQLHLKFFRAEEVELIGQLITVIRSHRESFLQQWRELYASMFGAHLACSEQLFHETYVPYLRSAVLRLGDGDAEGFSGFSAILGQHLAANAVPFSVLVAHLNLLKESCIAVLAGQDGEISRPMRLTIGKLTACSISAAADSYYRYVSGGGRAGRSSAPDAGAAPRSGPIPGVFHGVVGRSAVMQRVFEQIKRVAPGNAPVLIAGETGTGKELIARAIHTSGPRRNGPFVAVNCAALPRELIESELFGYTRGAFSGAVSDHLGLFRAAASGTLLLDEITEMGPELQAKLLRVVQERTVRPVGSVREVPVDVRIIASTNRDPQAIVAHGMLRPDLYYRLCVSMITTPPLRERGDDILLLVEHHLAALNERYGNTVEGVRSLTSDAMSELIKWMWPGNVRELYNVLEDAFTTCSGLHIGRADLALPRSPAIAVPPQGLDAAETFEAGERALIVRALTATSGNKLQAARQLGISRKKLYAKIAKYSLRMLMLSSLAGTPTEAAPAGPTTEALLARSLSSSRTAAPSRLYPLDTSRWRAASEGNTPRRPLH